MACDFPPFDMSLLSRKIINLTRFLYFKNMLTQLNIKRGRLSTQCDVPHVVKMHARYLDYKTQKSKLSMNCVVLYLFISSYYSMYNNHPPICTVILPPHMQRFRKTDNVQIQ